MDRTVKVLLAVIAVALWGLLLRPLLNLPSAQAAPTARNSATGNTAAPAIVLLPNTHRALVVQNGTLYEVDFSGHTQKFVAPSTAQVVGAVRLQ